jgi:hypothetical protein
MTHLPDQDLGDADRELTYLAGAYLLSKSFDLVRHHPDGDSWAPRPHDDAAEVAKQARDVIDHMDQAVQEARHLLADAERPARFRTVRRQRQQRSQARRDRDEERER